MISFPRQSEHFKLQSSNQEPQNLMLTIFCFKNFTKLSKMRYSSCVSIVSKCSVFPSEESTMGDLKLSVSDLAMLTCLYMQRGCIFLPPPFPSSQLIPLLRSTLSNTLTQFPPLAGRLTTDSDGIIYVACNDAGVDFIHANAPNVFIRDILVSTDVPDQVKGFFAFNGVINYEAHLRPITAVQVTELADGVFIGCSVNHAVADGVSFWNFFNAFADASRGTKRISPAPNFSRESVFMSSAVMKFPTGGPQVTFSLHAPLRERIFSFSKNSISKLKARATTPPLRGQRVPGISSFQALCALLWRGVTRAMNLPPSKMTTFRIVVNCRHRLEPKLEPLYFGNAIQSILINAAAGDLLTRDLSWCAEQLTIKVRAHDNLTVRKLVQEWKRDPQCLSSGNPEGAMLTVASSPKFRIYDNDFGWGRPVAIRSGRANRFEGNVLAIQGREGSGSIDLEVVLAPEIMRCLEADREFMQYASNIS